MKNKISLRVIYRDNKPSADCAIRRGKNEKKLQLQKLYLPVTLHREVCLPLI